jgi:hypothetical protein
VIRHYVPREAGNNDQVRCAAGDGAAEMNQTERRLYVIPESSVNVLVSAEVAFSVPVAVRF